MGIVSWLTNRKAKVLKNEPQDDAGNVVVVPDLSYQEESARNTEVYKNLVRHLDRSEDAGLRRIKGTRYHTYQITELLRNHGMAGFVKDNMGITTMAQVIPVSWTENGYIHEFTCLQSFQNRNRLDPHKKYVNHVNGVILYDTFDNGHIPRAALMNAIVDDMGQLFQRLQDNILLSGDRIAFKSVDKDNHQQIKREITKQLKAGNPVLLLQSIFGDKLEGMKTDAKFMELWSNIKQYDIFRQRLHGLGNGNNGNDKNERLLTGELESQSDATNAVLESRKIIYEEWVDEMLAVLGETVTVEWRV